MTSKQQDNQTHDERLFNLKGLQCFLAIALAFRPSDSHAPLNTQSGPSVENHLRRSHFTAFLVKRRAACDVTRQGHGMARVKNLICSVRKITKTFLDTSLKIL